MFVGARKDDSSLSFTLHRGRESRGCALLETSAPPLPRLSFVNCLSLAPCYASPMPHCMVPHQPLVVCWLRLCAAASVHCDPLAVKTSQVLVGPARNIGTQLQCINLNLPLIRWSCESLSLNSASWSVVAVSSMSVSLHWKD